jgi:hypothetical protein
MPGTYPVDVGERDAAGKNEKSGLRGVTTEALCASVVTPLSRMIALT